MSLKSPVVADRGIPRRTGLVYLMLELARSPASSGPAACGLIFRRSWSPPLLVSATLDLRRSFFRSQ